MADKAVISSPSSFGEGMGSSQASRWLNSGLSANALRSNDLLRKDEWVSYDTTLVKVAGDRLNIIADLRADSLVRNLGGLGVLVTEYEKQTEMTPANIDMAGVTPGREDSIGFILVGVPIPIIHKDFRINIRRLLASRRNGEGIDVSSTEAAARTVVEAMEDLVTNGASGIVINGQALYGLTNFADTLPETGSDWGTIANIITSIEAAIAAAEENHMYGPFRLYVATPQWGQMRSIYSDGSRESAFERVSRVYPQIRSMKAGDRLTAGTAVLVQMTSDVIQLAIAQDITNVEWNTLGGMVAHFKVLAAMAPIVKSDAEGQTGIVYLTGI